MEDFKNPVIDNIDSTEGAAKMAEAIEKLAALREGIGSFTYSFKEPFAYEGRTSETLTFDWSRLTGADSLAIENGMVRRGKTLVAPAYTGDYLVGMAVRACTERDAGGNRVVTEQMLRALPLGAFRKICDAARDFLLFASM